MDTNKLSASFPYKSLTLVGGSLSFLFAWFQEVYPSHADDDDAMLY